MGTLPVFVLLALVGQGVHSQGYRKPATYYFGQYGLLTTTTTTPATTQTPPDIESADEIRVVWPYHDMEQISVQEAKVRVVQRLLQDMALPLQRRVCVRVYRHIYDTAPFLVITREEVGEILMAMQSSTSSPDTGVSGDDQRMVLITRIQQKLVQGLKRRISIFIRLLRLLKNDAVSDRDRIRIDSGIQTVVETLDAEEQKEMGRILKGDWLLLVSEDTRQWWANVVILMSKIHVLLGPDRDRKLSIRDQVVTEEVALLKEELISFAENVGMTYTLTASDGFGSVKGQRTLRATIRLIVRITSHLISNYSTDDRFIRKVLTTIQRQASSAISSETTTTTVGSQEGDRLFPRTQRQWKRLGDILKKWISIVIATSKQDVNLSDLYLQLRQLSLELGQSDNEVTSFPTMSTVWRQIRHVLRIIIRKVKTLTRHTPGQDKNDLNTLLEELDSFAVQQAIEKLVSAEPNEKQQAFLTLKGLTVRILRRIIVFWKNVNVKLEQELEVLLEQLKGTESDWETRAVSWEDDVSSGEVEPEVSEELSEEDFTSLSTEQPSDARDVVTRLKPIVRDQIIIIKILRNKPINDVKVNRDVDTILNRLEETPTSETDKRTAIGVVLKSLVRRVGSMRPPKSETTLQNDWNRIVSVISQLTNGERVTINIETGHIRIDEGTSTSDLKARGRVYLWRRLISDFAHVLRISQRYLSNSDLDDVTAEDSETLDNASETSDGESDYNDDWDDDGESGQEGNVGTTSSSRPTSGEKPLVEPIPSPEEFSCTSEGRFPVPQSCHEYYVCFQASYGQLHQQKLSCSQSGEGPYFNPGASSCSTNPPSHCAYPSTTKAYEYTTTPKPTYGYNYYTTTTPQPYTYPTTTTYAYTTTPKPYTYPTTTAYVYTTTTPKPYTYPTTTPYVYTTTTPQPYTYPTTTYGYPTTTYGYPTTAAAKYY